MDTGTRQQYERMWRRFDEFAGGKGFDPLSPSPGQLCLFFWNLGVGSNSSGAIRMAHAFLKFYLLVKKPGLEKVVDHPTVLRVLKGLNKSLAKPVEKRKPRAGGDMAKLFKSTLEKSASLFDRRFGAWLILAC